MTEKQPENEKPEKLGYNTDPLSIAGVLEAARKTEIKVYPKVNITGYPVQDTRNGRPYFYVQWFEKDYHGIRRHKKHYLGTALPIGYAIGKPVEIPREWMK